MPIHTPYGDIDNYRLFTWLRQQRLRAREDGIEAACSRQQLIEIFESSRWRCAFCNQPATNAVRLFTRKSRAPLVPANIAPSCKACSKIIIQHQRCLFDLVPLGLIDKARARKVLDDAIKREGAGFWLKQMRGQLVGV